MFWQEKFEILKNKLNTFIAESWTDTMSHLYSEGWNLTNDKLYLISFIWIEAHM